MALHTPSFAFLASDVELLFISMLRSRLLECGAGLVQGDAVDGSLALPELFVSLSAEDKLDVYAQLCAMLGISASACGDVLSQSLTATCSAAFELWREGPESITFLTSGSTGAPVACTQALSLLWQEISFLASLQKGRKRVVGVVPQHHIYGFLFTLLLPKILEAECLIVPPYPGQAFMSQLREGDLVVAFPMFWKGLSELDLICPQGVAGVTSTGPCPAEVIQTLCVTGFERITEVYGSSETGGVGYRHAPDQPYELFTHWQMDDGLLCRYDASGKILLSLPFPDQVEWASERRFRPVRRVDKAVQVAGRNVYPDKVAKVLLEHPVVAECAVRLMRPEEGHRLKAFVVPVDANSDHELLKKELRIWCRERCSVAEQPKKIDVGHSLPKNSMGKLTDW